MGNMGNGSSSSSSSSSAAQPDISPQQQLDHARQINSVRDRAAMLNGGNGGDQGPNPRFISNQQPTPLNIEPGRGGNQMHNNFPGSGQSSKNNYALGLGGGSFGQLNSIDEQGPIDLNTHMLDAARGTGSFGGPVGAAPGSALGSAPGSAGGQGNGYSSVHDGQQLPPRPPGAPQHPGGRGNQYGQDSVL